MPGLILSVSTLSEPLERGPRTVDHAQGRVAGVRERRGRFDDPLQHGIEGELGADRNPRLEQGAQPLGVADGRHPGTIVSSGCDRVDAVLVSASLRAASLGQLRDRVRDVERRDDPDRTIRSVPEHDQVVRLVFVH